MLLMLDFAKHLQLRLAERTDHSSSYSGLRRPKEQRVIVSLTLTLENCAKQQQKSPEREAKGKPQRLILLLLELLQHLHAQAWLQLLGGTVSPQDPVLQSLTAG